MFTNKPPYRTHEYALPLSSGFLFVTKIAALFEKRIDSLFFILNGITCNPQLTTF